MRVRGSARGSKQHPSPHVLRRSGLLLAAAFALAELMGMASVQDEADA